MEWIITWPETELFDNHKERKNQKIWNNMGWRITHNKLLWVSRIQATLDWFYGKIWSNNFDIFHEVLQKLNSKQSLDLRKHLPHNKLNGFQESQGNYQFDYESLSTCWSCSWNFLEIKFKITEKYDSRQSLPHLGLFLSFRFPPSSTPSRRPRRYCSGTRCWVVRQHKPERGEGEKRGEKLKGREIVGRSDWADLLPFIFRERNWGEKGWREMGLVRMSSYHYFFLISLFYIYVGIYIHLPHHPSHS